MNNGKDLCVITARGGLPMLVGVIINNKNYEIMNGDVYANRMILADSVLKLITINERKRLLMYAAFPVNAFIRQEWQKNYVTNHARYKHEKIK